MGLASIKPGHAILDPHRIVVLDFVPTWENYAVTLAGAGPASFDSRASLANTAIVALMSTAIATPMIRGGVAATAVLYTIFSWAEFLMSLFLTSQIRMFPVQASIVVTNMWGYTSALGTAAMLPAFVFILLVQRHLVRSLTLGMTKG